MLDPCIDLRILAHSHRRRLADDVYCPYLPNEETYKRDLVQAGFELVTVRCRAGRFIEREPILKLTLVTHSSRISRRTGASTRPSA